MRGQWKIFAVLCKLVLNHNTHLSGCGCRPLSRKEKELRDNAWQQVVFAQFANKCLPNLWQLKSILWVWEAYLKIYRLVGSTIVPEGCCPPSWHLHPDGSTPIPRDVADEVACSDSNVPLLHKDGLPNRCLPSNCVRWL